MAKHCISTHTVLRELFYVINFDGYYSDFIHKHDYRVTERELPKNLFEILSVV